MNASRWGMTKLDRGWPLVIRSESIQEVTWASEPAGLLANTAFDRSFDFHRFAFP